MVRVLIDGENKELQFQGTIEELIKKLDYSIEEVLVKKNGELVPETETVNDKDKIEIIKVIFGG